MYTGISVVKRNKCLKIKKQTKTEIPRNRGKRATMTSQSRASSHDEPWMNRTNNSVGSAMAQPLGMSQS